MMKLFSSRIFVHHVAMDESGQTFRDFQKLTRDSMTFVTSELKFLKPLYDLSILHKPLLVKVVGGHIGNTSLNAITIVSLESSDTELMSNINQVVYIDPSTRKPTPLPNWRPSETGHCRFQVTWTFTDGYNHANWTSYAQYVIDAAYLCSKQGSLKYFVENIKNGISKVQLHYYGESIEGDYLDINAWEDTENTKKVVFDMSKDGTSIFQCIMYFF